jgi:glycosyltransferase involved in cell wall biosynthesis
MTSIESQRRVAVSIIIPVFNTSEYLARCLDSVLSQTVRDIEIIAVDDGSSDRSLDILQRYAADDHRLKIVRHERNEGLHIARISGVLAASGQYFGYVDSDDYISADMYECLYRHAVDRHADVVRTGAWLLREGDAHPPVNQGSPTSLSFPERVYETGIEYLDADFYPSMWLHLHHRRLWDMALPHFPRIRLIGEDNLTGFVLAFFANRVISLSNLGYFYVERGNSLSGDPSFASVARHIQDRGRIMKLLRAFLDAAGGQAERSWKSVRSSNIGLLFSYIGALENRNERLAAIALFEQGWGECVPAELKATWSRD